MKKAVFVNELIWLSVALFFAIGICVPVIAQTAYAYLPYNLLIVFVSFTYIRYIITFKSLLFLKGKWIRVVWFMANILLFIFVLNRLEYVVRWYDSFAFFELFQSKTLSVNQQKTLADYVFTEYVIFSIATFVGLIGFNIKLLASFWSKSKVKSEKIIKE